MPLAVTLRKRLSSRTLHENHGDISRDPTEGVAAGGTALLQPQSAAARRSATHLNANAESISSRPLRPTTAVDRPVSATWKRFSLLQHKSDPQLSVRYKNQADVSRPSSPSACPAPVIGVTAPTWDPTESDKPKRRLNIFPSKQPTPRSISYNSGPPNPPPERASTARRSSFRSRKSFSGTSTSDQRDRLWSTSGLWAPSMNRSPSLASTQISGQSSGQVSPAVPGTPPVSEGTSTKRFRLPRRKKQKIPASLFPLPVHLSPSNTLHTPLARHDPTTIPVQPSPLGSSHSTTQLDSTPHGASTPSSLTSQSNLPPPSRSSGAPSTNSHSDRPAIPPPLARHSSSNSAPAVPCPDMPPSMFTFRGRSGTTSSFGSRRNEERADTPFNESVARTSMTSTTLGRNSIAGLRSFTSKLRHPSESSPRHASPTGHNSFKNNSFAISKEALTVPDREEGESAAQYYGRLERTVPKKEIGQLFSKSRDQFSHDVLRSLLRTFKFFEEPMDISLRRFLWEIDLPAEAQQIDRLLSAFAQRYLECNTTIFDDSDEVYLLAFSLVMLHSDVFNTSNKRKMQRHEYQQNTRAANVDEELLGYFYDNIQYTEFINQDDEADDDESSTRSRRAKARRKVKKVTLAATDTSGESKVDPYDFILGKHGKLDVLRPALKGVMQLDDTYHYFGTANILDIRAIGKAFNEPAILQTISSRSRPDAFRQQATIDNPFVASAGVVEIKIAKAGIVWRKDPKKKPARSPWQEWGVLLTQSQLHFFRNKDWVKDLVKQAENHNRQMKNYEVQIKQVQDSEKLQKLQVARDRHASKRVVFRPPVQDFKPDYSIKTPSITALLDNSYDKHKHGFLLVNHDAFLEEMLLADDEREMNDWLAKINFASAFTTSKVDPQSDDAPHQLQESGVTLQNGESTVSSEAATSVGPVDPTLARLGQGMDILSAPTTRQRIIKSKIEDIGSLLHGAERKLGQQLKTARHLQITAPFPGDTRSAMLSFGARCAHRVRWTRFEIWRLKSHRDMLGADLAKVPYSVERDPKIDSAALRTASPRLLPTALSRLNTKASAIMNVQKNGRSGHTPRETARPRLATHVTDFAGSMDQALSPPAELTRFASAGHEGPFKLPPLVLTTTEEDRPPSSGTDSVARKNSVISDTSRLAPAARSLTPPPHGTPKAEGTDTSSKKRPSTAIDHEQSAAFGSPSNRPGNRRSLQRTLRDSRDISSSTRSKRARESLSGTGTDEITQEQLSRAPGSFTLHGKKASVITLGSEFQHLPAEERLRARKQALALEHRQGPSEAEEDSIRSASRLRPSITRSSRHGSDPSLLEAPVVESDGDSIQYMAKGAVDDIIDVRRLSSTTFGTTVAGSEVGYREIDHDEENEEYHEAIEPSESFRKRLPEPVASATSLSLQTQPPAEGEK